MSVLSRQSTAAGPPLPPVSNASHGSQILAIAGSFTALATLAVIVRVYVRAVMLKTMGADDYVMILATVCSIFVFISFVVQVHLGIGEHIGNPHIMSNFITIMHWSYFHAWVLVIGISSVKISVGLFLLRLVQARWYKRFIMSWICFLMAFTLACVGTLVFQCSPISAAWDFTQRANAKCYSTKIYRDIGLFNGAVNIFTDFIFATLPLPIVMPLQMNIRTKLSVIGVLSLGYFACSAAIVREVLLSTFFTDPDYSFNDSYQVWNDIEITAGILAACLPTLRPFFAFLLDSAASITHRSGGAPGSAVPRHRYYMQKEEEDISMKLGPIRSHGTGNSSNKLTKSGYGVTVIGGASTSSHDREGERDRDLERGSGWGVPKASNGPRGILEQSLERDDGSEEGILSPVERVQTDLNGLRKDGIVRTREIHIS